MEPDGLELCCKQEIPVAGEDALDAMWTDESGKRQWFASDRYNYLYVRIAAGPKRSHPWREKRVGLYLAFTRYAEDKDRWSWTALVSNKGDSLVKLEKDRSGEHYASIEPFLIPPVFPGDYTVIADLRTEEKNEEELLRLDIDCQETPPCVWEGSWPVSPGKTICLTGGTWNTGSWRFLSAQTGTGGTMTKGIPLPLPGSETGRVIPTIFVDKLSLLAGLNVESKDIEEA